MISELEKSQIDELLYNVDLQASIQALRASQNPCFLFMYMESYNWDDGLEIPSAVADNPCCDLGTALLLFWLSGAIQHFQDNAATEQYGVGLAQFCLRLISRISAGHYKLGPTSYDPALNRVEIYKIVKLGVPAVFYTPVIGAPPPN